MPDDRDEEDFLSKVRRSNAETAKLIDESYKLRAEELKLRAEELKLYAEHHKFNHDGALSPLSLLMSAMTAGRRFSGRAPQASPHFMELQPVSGLRLIVASPLRSAA